MSGSAAFPHRSEQEPVLASVCKRLDKAGKMLVLPLCRTVRIRDVSAHLRVVSAAVAKVEAARVALARGGGVV